MYSYTNSKGKIYYLHRRIAQGNTFTWFFSSNPDGAVELPSFYEVIENPQNKIPLIKRKKDFTGGISG